MRELTTPTCSRRSWLLAALLCAGGVWPVHAQPPGKPVDLPGAEPVLPGAGPEVLEPLLPAFEAAPLEWPVRFGPLHHLRLSPTGRYCLAKRINGGRESILLLDENGRQIRDLTENRFQEADAVWGATDEQVLLEVRVTPNQPPAHLRVNPLAGTHVPAALPGLPHWAAGARDYHLDLGADDDNPHHAGLQRYTAADAPVGRPLAATAPVWSGDGQWLAFIARQPQAETEEAAALPWNEVRVLPARGEVPRVILSRGGWERLARTHGWLGGSGPRQVAWSPTGDALYVMFNARTPAGERKYLARLEIRTPKRELLEVPLETEILSVSANARHWIVRLGERLFRLDFAAPSITEKAPPPAAPRSR